LSLVSVHGCRAAKPYRASLIMIRILQNAR
jgi:hypothetical protein